MASTERCANCGKQGDGFKRCTICKDAHYCGPACQKDDWKHHKKKCTTPVPIQLKDVGAKTECTPPVPLVEFRAKVDAARKAKDWRAVLKYEGQLEEMLNCKWPGVANIPDWMQRNSAHLLTAFSYAHHDGFVETGKIEHTRAFHGYAERLIPMLGELQHFRDQADAMCMLSRLLGAVGRKSESATWFQRARDVGAANGFFSLESKACVGLGNLAFLDGRHEEAEGLMRNALVAAELNEMDDPEYELYAISPLIKMLFETSCIDEVEPLVLRYREAAMGYWKNGGIFSIAGVDCFICSARLHEARGKPQEAAREVRALLDAMSKNRENTERLATAFLALLLDASGKLTILGVDSGRDVKLRHAVAVATRELATPDMLRSLGSNSTRLYWLLECG